MKGWRRIIVIALFLGTASCAQQLPDSAPSLTPRTFFTFEHRIRVVPVPGLGRTGYKPEIYALGIRDALGLIVHPETGELWENENGPQGGDEINIIRAGRNYGWPIISYGRAYAGQLEDLSAPSSEVPLAPGLEQPLLYWCLRLPFRE